jgi:uncharacterized protein YodC (DUF2158 family)
MNLTEFKKCDLVYHRTRPYLTMIVTDMIPDDMVKCSWMTKKGKYHIDIFYNFELEHKE